MNYNIDIASTTVSLHRSLSCGMAFRKDPKARSLSTTVGVSLSLISRSILEQIIEDYLGIASLNSSIAPGKFNSM